MIKAFPYSKSEYYIRGDRSGDTFHRKDEFKGVGAWWDGRHWIVTESQLAKLPYITKMTWVKIKAHCHEPEGGAFATPADLKRGKVDVGCGMCDSRNGDAEIICEESLF